MNLSSVMIGSENPKQLADYYRGLFGEPAYEDGGYNSWQLGVGSLSVAPHDQVKGKNPSPGRIILNIESDDVKGDFDRLKSAGAIVVREPYQMDGWEGWIATLSDPDDNYFQLMSPMTG